MIAAGKQLLSRELPLLMRRERRRKLRCGSLRSGRSSAAARSECHHFDGSRWIILITSVAKVGQKIQAIHSPPTAGRGLARIRSRQCRAKAD